MGLDAGAVLEVDPQRVQTVADGLRARHLLVADQRRGCDRIELSGGDPDNAIGVKLELFTSLWGSAMMAMAHELELLGVELGKSAQAVASVDRAGAR